MTEDCTSYGPAYSPAVDGKRIRRQHEAIRELMLDGAWRTLKELETLTGYAQGSISAQLRHLRKSRFGSYRVPRRRRAGGTWEYAVAPPLPSGQQVIFVGQER